MVTKAEQLAALAGHARVFDVTTTTDVTAESKFGHGDNTLYRIEFYEIQNDAVVARHCHMVVVDEGEPAEDAKWFGGEPVSEWQGESLVNRVRASTLFQSRNGKILQVRENCIIASVFLPPDVDEVEEEIIIRIYDDAGTLTFKKVQVVTTPPLPQ